MKHILGLAALGAVAGYGAGRGRRAEVTQVDVAKARKYLISRGFRSHDIDKGGFSSWWGFPEPRTLHEKYQRMGSNAGVFEKKNRDPEAKARLEKERDAWYALAHAALKESYPHAKGSSARGLRARTRGERRGLTEKHRAKMIRAFAVRKGLTPRQVEEELKRSVWTEHEWHESGEWRGLQTESELRRALESMLAHGPRQREYRRKSKREPLRRRRKEEKHRGRRAPTTDWFYEVSHKGPRGKRGDFDFRTGIVSVSPSATQQQIRVAIDADAAKHGPDWSIVGYGPGRRNESRFKVGDRVKFRGRWGWEKTGQIVAETISPVKTPAWIIEWTGATGRVVREHILQGDILAVVGGSSARGRRAVAPTVQSAKWKRTKDFDYDGTYTVTITGTTGHKPGVKKMQFRNVFYDEKWWQLSLPVSSKGGPVKLGRNRKEAEKFLLWYREAPRKEKKLWHGTGYLGDPHEAWGWDYFSGRPEVGWDR